MTEHDDVLQWERKLSRLSNEYKELARENQELILENLELRQALDDYINLLAIAKTQLLNTNEILKGWLDKLEEQDALERGNNDCD